MIPEEGDGAGKRRRNRPQDPIWQLPPMRCLNIMELRPDKSPSAENVDFVRPDRAYVVEGEREVEKEERFHRDRLSRDPRSLYSESSAGPASGSPSTSARFAPLLASGCFPAALSAASARATSPRSNAARSRIAAANARSTRAA